MMMVEELIKLHLKDSAQPDNLLKKNERTKAHIQLTFKDLFLRIRKTSTTKSS